MSTLGDDLGLLAPGLRLRSDGIWYSESLGDVSYPEDAHKILCDIEASGSFWFEHRLRVILAGISAYPPPGVLFDVGGGNGYVSLALVEAGVDTVLIEPGPGAARNARARGLRNVICATFEEAGFEAGSIPAVGLFDVVEHMQRDVEFLSSIRERMAPVGRVYITVPGYPTLWSHEDELAGHFRRYNRKSICDAVEGAGLEVEFASYFFRQLPPFIFLLRTLPYRLGRRVAPSAESVRNTHSAGNEALRRLLLKTLEGEVGRIQRKSSMAYGGSCFVVARCPR